MIDLSHLRKRRSSSVRLNFSNSASKKDSQENLPPKLNLPPTQILTVKSAENIPSKPTLPDLTEPLNSLSKILKNSSNLGKNGKISELEDQVGEIQERILKTFEGQDNVVVELGKIAGDSQKRIQEISEVVGRTCENIKNLQQKKEKIAEVVNLANLKNMFFRDFCNLEIVDVVEEPWKVRMICKYENKYVKFVLAECDEQFDYHLEECNFEIPEWYDYYGKDILFDKVHFRRFYVDLMDLIYNTE